LLSVVFRRRPRGGDRDAGRVHQDDRPVYAADEHVAAVSDGNARDTALVTRRERTARTEDVKHGRRAVVRARQEERGVPERDVRHAARVLGHAPVVGAPQRLVC